MDPSIRVLGSGVMSAKGQGSAEVTLAAGKGDQVDVVDQIMSINRRLVVQIETLRLKVDVDKRQFDKATSGVLSVADRKQQLRDLELENLRSELRKKEDAVQNLAEDNNRKGAEISTLQSHIDQLRADMEESKAFVDDMQGQLEILQVDKAGLEDGSTYQKKDEQMNRLVEEVANLKTHLETLETELVIAKDKIALQGGQMRISDLDRANMQIKLKDEMAKVSINLRREIEITREVMQKQWREIRELRQQNEGMRSDIRDIKDMLTAEVTQRQEAAQDNQMQNIYGHAGGPYSVKTKSPSLPSISKSTKRSVKKK